MIDDIDRKILNILQNNARTPNAEVARQVGMAPSAVFERIKKLEKKGVILGYEARINPQALDLGLVAYTSVLSEEQVGCTDAGARLAEIEEVQEVHYTAGRDYYLIKARVKNTESLAGLLQKFGQVQGIRDTRTTIVLSTIKETTCLPVFGQQDKEQE